MTSTSPFAPRARTTQEPEPDLTSIVVTHRAIRQDLQRLTACLAEIPGGGAPPSRARAIGRYTTALLAEIRAHHHHEDGIIWPVIAATAGQAVDLTPLTDDHQAIDTAVGRASQALASFTAGTGTTTAALRASISELRDMLEEHIADEQEQIFPAMRRYLPADAYQRCQKQIQRTASRPGVRFTGPWLARHAEPDELSRLLAAGGWPARIVLAATRPGYARLERQAFGASPADHHTRHVPHRTFPSSPGGTMFQSYQGRLAGLHRQAQRDAPAPAVRRSRPGTRPRTAWSRAGTRLSRLAVALAAVTVGLLASAAAIPAAFADIPPGLYGRSRVAPVSPATAGGPAVWQIALIGVGVPLAATVAGVLLRRVRAARRAVPSSAG